MAVVFEVFSVDHRSGRIGAYFNFSIAQAHSVLGRPLVHNERLNLSNARTGEERLAVVWTRANGGSKGDGHGRWDASYSDGDWRVGDLLAFVTEPVEDDVSVGTNESQWNVVGTDDEWESPKVQHVLIGTPSDSSEPEAETDEDEAEEEAEAEPEAEAKRDEPEKEEEEELKKQTPLSLEPYLVTSATFLAAAPLYLGSHLLTECAGHQGDVSEQWAPALQAFPKVCSAQRLGRVTVSWAEVCSGKALCMPVVAKIMVANRSGADWPAATSLRLVAGEGHGFDSMEVGAVANGQTAQLALDLEVSAHALRAACRGLRSGWVLEDGNGEPFGPLLVFEVALC